MKCLLNIYSDNIYYVYFKKYDPYGPTMLAKNFYQF